jgi:RimJ/RimL family protein N-acetyltransferase
VSDAWIAPASDARFLNLVANDSTVRPWVDANVVEGDLDLSPLLDDPQNYICLVGRYGFAIFAALSPHLYHWHAAVLPQGRGKWALDAARASLDWLFTKTSAAAVFAAIPQPNRPARHIVAALGFRLVAVAPAAWPSPAGPVALFNYALLRKQWRLVCQ